MKVADLIAALQSLPPDIDVVIDEADLPWVTPVADVQLRGINSAGTLPRITEANSPGSKLVAYLT